MTTHSFLLSHYIRPDRLVWLAMLAALLGFGAPVHAAYKWQPIPPEHLNARPETPETEEAGAEILQANRTISFTSTGMVHESFFRIKLYAERMSEEVGRLKILLVHPAVLDNCGARVIRPDGSVREYDSKDFPEVKTVERKAGTATTGFVVDDPDQTQKSSGVSLRQLQITDLQAGDIVEYFSVINENMAAVIGYGGERILNLQEVFPIRALEFTLKRDTWNEEDFQSAVSYINLPNAKLTKVAGENIRITGELIPAFHPEKDMPPERDIRAAIIMRLASGLLKFSWRNWSDFAQYFAAEAKNVTRPTGPIKKLAAQLTASATTTEEKLRRLHDYCQREITNLDFDTLAGQPRLSAAEKSGLTATRTLERRLGTATSITKLFVALAQAAGLDATLAITTRSNELLRADRIPLGWLFMNEVVAAVKQDGQWHYYSPGMRWAPFGQLYWQNQGTAVLRGLEGKKPAWDIRPVVTDLAHDRLTRQGDFTLDAHGVLTGSVIETLDGQAAMSWRHRHRAKNKTKLNTVVRNRSQQLFSSAELTAIQIEDDHDNTHPVILRYHVRVPDFATTTGDRLIFAPNALNARAQPLYTEEHRGQPIRWNYGSVVTDEMQIQLPAGYKLEAGDAPANVDYAHVAGIKYTTTLQYIPGKNQIRSNTVLTTGLEGKTLFQPKAYQALKQIFEKINQAQTHTLVLQPIAESPTEPAVTSEDPAATAAVTAP